MSIRRAQREMQEKRYLTKMTKASIMLHTEDLAAARCRPHKKEKSTELAPPRKTILQSGETPEQVNALP